VRGAYYSKGGLSFIVNRQPRRTARCHRANAARPSHGSAHKCPIATEHGLCNIRRESSAERAYGLIEIAEPAFRDELTAAARDMHLI
jgi:itaconate CoA-transferase